MAKKKESARKRSGGGKRRGRSKSTGNGAGQRSASKAAGGPRSTREYSAGGVVVRARVRGTPPDVLLIRDSYGNWGFPKGHVEVGEKIEQAAVREVREETGLAGVDIVGQIDRIDWWFRFRGKLIHKYCDFYLMAVPDGSAEQASPQTDEGISACEWVDLDEARRRLTYVNARGVLEKAFARLAEHTRHTTS